MQALRLTLCPDRYNAFLRESDLRIWSFHWRSDKGRAEDSDTNYTFPAHSAIKASNIVIDADGCVQLCHMRDCLNMMADGVRIHAVHKYSGTAASIPWFAPEILDQVRSRDSYVL
jgi:sugar lactone lactonase YvrE